MTNNVCYGLLGVLVVSFVVGRIQGHPHTGKETLQPPKECRNTTFCQHPDSSSKEFTEEDQRSSTVDTIANGKNEEDVYGTSCPNVESVIYPKTAKSHTGETFYIVNDGITIQPVRIKTCLPATNAQCGIDHIRPDYTSYCKQYYANRALKAFASNGTVIRQSFPFPSGCLCEYKSSGNP